MRRLGLIALLILVPHSAQAAVLVNEIAWMGTAANANAEWLELWNPGATAVELAGWHLVAESGSPSISLTGTIAANGYYLLERTSDASVPGVTADLVYTGALTNSGTNITLSDGAGAVADRVIGGANWSNVGGDNATKDTAQRTATGWITSAPTPRAQNPGAATAAPQSSADGGESYASSTPAGLPDAAVTGTPEYAPIPVLRIVTGGDRTVASGADTAFTALVYDAKGNKRNDATVTWSFGDGMRRSGASVYHTYWEPGEYAVIVKAATSDGGEAFAERIVTAKFANLQIVSVTPRGVSITNASTRTVDISLWRLRMGGGEFKIPEDTHILADRTILLPSQIIQLPFAGSATLLYPNGEVAAAYPQETVQPPPVQSSLHTMQTSRAITSPQTNAEAHDDGMIAPGAAAETAAPGAAAVAKAQVLTEGEEGSKGLFHSPWTYGLLGIIALAAAVFIRI